MVADRLLSQDASLLSGRSPVQIHSSGQSPALLLVRRIVFHFLPSSLLSASFLFLSLNETLQSYVQSVLKSFISKSIVISVHVPVHSESSCWTCLLVLSVLRVDDIIRVCWWNHSNLCDIIFARWWCSLCLLRISFINNIIAVPCWHSQPVRPMYDVTFCLWMTSFSVLMSQARPSSHHWPRFSHTKWLSPRWHRRCHSPTSESAEVTSRTSSLMRQHRLVKLSRHPFMPPLL